MSFRSPDREGVQRLTDPGSSVRKWRTIMNRFGWRAATAATPSVIAVSALLTAGGSASPRTPIR